MLAIFVDVGQQQCRTPSKLDGATSDTRKAADALNNMVCMVGYVNTSDGV